MDYFSGQINVETEFLDHVFFRILIQVGDRLLTETLQGFRDDKEFQCAKNALSNFGQVQMLNRERAVCCADNYRFLRKNGITIRKTIDGIIAAYCLMENHSLLHRDNE